MEISDGVSDIVAATNLTVRRANLSSPRKRIDHAAILKRVRKLYSLYTRGRITGPEKHEVHPGLPASTRENYLYFTLSCAINFQRNSPAMWRSALETFLDPNTRYVFYPEQSTKVSQDKLKASLTQYRLALQPNKHTDIWLRISESLLEHYDGDPRNVLAEYDFEVPKIIRALQVDKKRLFPYLSGVKLSNYWLFILAQFTDAALRNLDEISIIPDTHIIRSTIRLGLASEGVTASRVEMIWRDVLRETGIPSIEMHSALWRWSRNGFRPDESDDCECPSLA